ncbi:MAG: hypothetical protein GY705_00505 [Bacteroidetes bacterium]|nr:hypothetical protein [Bacteroidota bacterium]
MLFFGGMDFEITASLEKVTPTLPASVKDSTFKSPMEAISVEIAKRNRFDLR